MKRGILLAIMFLVSLCQAEVRSLWVLPWNIKTPQSIDAVIDDAIANNQNELLLEVRYRSDALYTPNRLSDRYYNPEPRSYILDNSWFDPLDYAIGRAKESGLRVQAWVVVFNATPLDRERLQENYMFQNHQDWLTRDGNGQRMNSREQYGYFLDPGVPEVQEYLLDIFSDIVDSYPQLDGIHLDYIRYPSNAFGYHPSSVERYQECKKHEELSWNEWRIRQVTEFVQKLGIRLKSIKPELILSAAVFSNIYEARKLYAQDWFDWLNRDLIDIAYPMAYHVKYPNFVNQMQAMQDNGKLDKIVVGLRAWNAKGGSLTEGQSPSYNINHIEDRIRYIREHEFAGIALFSYEGIIKDSVLRSLADRVYPEAVRLPELLAEASFAPGADAYFEATGDSYRVELIIPREGRWHWEIRDPDNALIYQRMRYYYQGMNEDQFSGILANGQRIPNGSYLLHLDKPGSNIKFVIPIIFEEQILERSE